MIQTVTQNSALSQNWVECTGCTLKGPRPHARCAHITPRPCACRVLGVVSWCTGRRVVALLRPCHRRVLPCRCAHARFRASCRNVWACRVAAPLSRHKESCRDTNSCRARSAPCRSHCRTCRNAPAPYCSPCRVLCCDTRPSSPSRYKNCIMIQAMLQALRAVLQRARARCWAVLQPVSLHPVTIQNFVS